MSAEPVVKRTVAFVDGQNLFHNARNVFGYTYPNYDVQRLAAAVCASRGWTLQRVYLYTGVPSPTDNAFWHGFWSNKLAMMGRRGVTVYSRPLVYRNKTIQVPGFGAYTFLAGEEKGIDVRLALDALDAAHRNEFDVAVIFSQDQDLSELASLIRYVAGFQNRWIKMASAFPDSPTAANRRGINGTDWCPIENLLMMPVSTRAITGRGHNGPPFCRASLTVHLLNTQPDSKLDHHIVFDRSIFKDSEIKSDAGGTTITVNTTAVARFAIIPLQDPSRLLVTFTPEEHDLSESQGS